MKTNKWKKLRHKIFPIYFDKWGIERPYKGGVVIWLWPWRRAGFVRWNGWTVGPVKYISLDFNGYFPTLESIDLTWKEYIKAIGEINA